METHKLTSFFRYPSQPKNTKKPKMSFSDDEIGNNMNQNQNNSLTIIDELTLQIANMLRNGLGISKHKPILTICQLVSN